MNNPLIYNAVLTGISGSTQNLTIRSSRTADYNDFGTRAALLALAVDALIVPTTVSEDEARLISSVAGGIDFNRCLQGTTPDYSAIAADIVRIWTEMSARIVFTPSDATVTVDKYEDLWLLTDETYSKAYIKGRNSPNDGGEGWFTNNPLSTYVEDYGTTAIAGTRAWVRDDLAKGEVWVEWFGVTGTDDTASFIRACAKSVGSTYAAWIADGGDNTTIASHVTWPVKYKSQIALTSTIEVRYRGLQLVGPNGYGEGYNPTALPGSTAPCIRAYHDGDLIKLWTGPNAGEVYCPSLALRNCILTRADGFLNHGGHGIHIDGATWFRGLLIESSTITLHDCGVKLGALYQASTNMISGLVVHGSSIIGNFKYGIDSGITTYWDLSDIRDSGLNHNGLGGIHIAIQAGTVERIDLEGGGDDNYIVGRNVRIGHFYFEQTGAAPYDDAGIKLYVRDSIVQGSVVSDGRPTAYNLQFSVNSLIQDQRPVRCQAANHCDIPSGWFVNNDSAQPLSVITHHCERAPYLKRLTSIAGSSAATVFTNASYTERRVFDGISLPAAPVGTPTTPDGDIGINVAATIVAGHSYLIAYAVHHKTTPTAFYSGCAITGFGQMSSSYCTDVPANGTVQYVGIFRASANAAVLPFSIFPYGTDGTFAGYGAAVSPISVIDVTGLAKVEQLHVPTLLGGNNNSDISVPFTSTGSSTAVAGGATVTTLTVKPSPLAASAEYSATLGVRCMVYSDADHTKCGNIDLAVELYISTDVDSTPTVTVLGVQIPDVSRLPAALVGATCAVSSVAGGFSVKVTAPAAVNIHAKTTTWITLDRII